MRGGREARREARREGRYDARQSGLALSQATHQNAPKAKRAVRGREAGHWHWPFGAACWTHASARRRLCRTFRGGEYVIVVGMLDGGTGDAAAEKSTARY